MSANVRYALILVATVALGCESAKQEAVCFAPASVGPSLAQVGAGGWGFESRGRRSTDALPSVDPRQQCRGIPVEQRESCPSEVMWRWVRSVANVDHGVLVRLSTNAGTAGQTAVRLRCHHAMTRRNPAHVCPINIRGLEIGVSRVRDELLLRLTTRDESQLDLLRARARTYLQQRGTS